jgi:hypothetical protein
VSGHASGEGKALGRSICVNGRMSFGRGQLPAVVEFVLGSSVAAGMDVVVDGMNSVNVSSRCVFVNDDSSRSS